MTMARDLRVAIAHEWISSRAGSEQTFETLAAAYPDADLFALSSVTPVPIELGGRELTTTRLDTPGLRDKRALTLAAMPWAWSGIQADDRYDVVITSSHAFARWFPPARAALHISYVHAPLRYVWMPELDERTRRGARLVRAVSGPLRRLDRRSLAWTDVLLANSTITAERIQRHYDREATVLPPPVDTDYYRQLEPIPRDQRDDYLLSVSRFVPYKRHDLAIETAERLGRPLIVVGSGGPDLDRIQHLARQSSAEVAVLVRPSDEELRELYRRASALLFPQVEDFGLVPVEAMAAGTPVAAVGLGGALDSVVPGRTGTLAQEQSAAALSEATSALLGNTEIRPSTCTAHAATFSRDSFTDRLRTLIETRLG